MSEGDDQDGNDGSEASDGEEQSDSNGPIVDKKLRRKILKDRKMSRKEKRALIFGAARPDSDPKDKAEAEEAPSKVDELKSTVFVSNLNFELTNDKFRDHAKKLGRIIYSVVGSLALQK